MFRDYFTFKHFGYALNNTGIYYEVVLTRQIGAYPIGSTFEFIFVSCDTGHIFLGGTQLNFKAILC